MKIESLVLAVALCGTLIVGCATGPSPRLVYKESQFDNRLEYQRFCQRYAMFDHRCD
ncbi:MAG TPA: hypothetical protein VIH18_11795 [Candidatus Binatia bacterium]